KSWQDDEQRDGLDYPLFWRRALLGATIGRALAEQLGLRNAEELFLTCLLQDIGMLALTRIVPGLYADIDDQAKQHRVTQTERDKLGVDHSAVGGWLLKNWNFPERIEQGVASSHDPSRIASVHPNATFVRCVHVAGLIAEHFLVADHDRRLPALTAAAQRTLGMSKAQLDDVIRAVKRTVPEMERVF